MIRTRPGLALVPFVLAGGLAGSTSASDEESPPLFAIHNGRRVPTVILPPKPAPGGAVAPALLEVVEFDAGEELDAAGAPNGWDDQEAPADRDRRRYTVGRYAGYPVSVVDWPGYGWGYANMPPSYYGDVLKEEYRARRWILDQERARAFNIRDMQQRKARVLASHEKALRLGLDELKRGNYAQAVVALQMAAQLNHADPACRIHLAQARLAQGHYEDAGKVLRRALQLQPKLVYVSLSLRAYYPEPEELDRHVARLADWLSARRAGAETHFLLGYLEFQRGDFAAAHAAFRSAATALPRDPLTQSYLEITKPPAR